MARRMGITGSGVARYRQKPDGKAREGRAREEGADARRDMDRKALNSLAKRGHLVDP